MSHASSHYDTLKVPQNASAEVIRAAYKHLARQCHPDRNSNSVESHQQMQRLNSAFDVLADPLRRASYDRTLASAVPPPAGAATSTILGKWIQSRRETWVGFVHRIEPTRKITFGRWAARAAFVILALWALNLDRKPTLHANPPSLILARPERAAKTVTPAPHVFVRPPLAPNGSPWPIHASEISGYPVTRNDGKSIIAIDNSRNPSDVFAKLISVDGTETTPVRHVYIPGRKVLELKNVRKGLYEVRYQDLGSGFMAKSGTFEVVEMTTQRTVSFSSMRITLARVTGTKPEGLRISGDEF